VKARVKAQALRDLILTKDAPTTASFDGLEIIPEAAEMAADSVRLNSLEGRIRIVCGDLRDLAAGRAAGEDVTRGKSPAKSGDRPDAGEEAARDAIKPGAYDAVTCNPPYYKTGSGRVSGEPAKAAARHELCCSLDEVAGAAAAALKSSGRFYMIHIPERLAEIFKALGRHGLEPKAMRLVHPRAGKEPTMVLIEAVKGGRPGIKVGPPLIVYEADGRYTKEVLAIYGKAEG